MDLSEMLREKADDVWCLVHLVLMLLVKVATGTVKYDVAGTAFIDQLRAMSS